MNTVESFEMEAVSVKSENIVHLPGGVLGFEQIKRYVLLCNPEEAPFAWLQALDDSTLAFLVLPPSEEMPHYQPEVSDEDAAYLGLKSPGDALIYNVVTLRSNGRATVNLKAPIVINRFNLRGKQVVLQNAAAYQLQHPLPVADSEALS